eukprot:CFRG8283T1
MVKGISSNNMQESKVYNSPETSQGADDIPIKKRTSLTMIKERNKEKKEKKALKTWVESNSLDANPRYPLLIRRAFVPLAVVWFIISYIFLGALFFSWIEDIDYLDSVYWAVVTLSTVGYGDISPVTIGGKYYFCAYIVLGLTVLVSAMTIVVDNVNSLKIEVKGGTMDPLPTIRTVLWQFLKAIAALLILITVGCFGFHWTADLNFNDSFYFTIETLSTVGYGDVSLDLNDGYRRTFVIIFIFLAVPYFAGQLGMLVDVFSDYLLLQRINKINEVGVCRKMLHEADLDNDGFVSKGEFILYYMVKISMIDVQMVKKVGDIFELFDEDGNGTLDVDDIRLPPNAIIGRQLIEQAKADQENKRFASLKSAAFNSTKPAATETKKMAASLLDRPRVETAIYVEQLEDRSEETDHTHTHMSNNNNTDGAGRIADPHMLNGFTRSA